jgi:hypothetical protein
VSSSLRDEVWPPTLTVGEVVALLALLGVLWGLVGLAGVGVWLVVLVAVAVLPAVVAVAIGQLALVAFPVEIGSPLVLAAEAVFGGLLLREGLTTGWGRTEAVVFVGLTGGLGGGVVLVTTQTSLLVSALLLVSVLIVGAVGLARLVPSEVGQLRDPTEDTDGV